MNGDLNQIAAVDPIKPYFTEGHLIADVFLSDDSAFAIDREYCRASFTLRFRWQNFYLSAFLQVFDTVEARAPKWTAPVRLETFNRELRETRSPAQYTFSNREINCFQLIQDDDR
jgi:hypothetical protein